MTLDSQPSTGWTWFRVPMDFYNRLAEIGRAAPVYIVLAKHADADGVAWPSHKTIAEVTGLSERSICRCLETLESVGLIEKKRRRRDTAVYVLAGFKTGQGCPIKESLICQNQHQDMPKSTVKICQNLRAYKEELNHRTKPKNKNQDTSHLKRFVSPSLDEIKAYCQERKNQIDSQRFFDYYESNGWRVGKNPMKSWQAAVRTWESNNFSMSRNFTDDQSGPIESED